MPDKYYQDYGPIKRRREAGELETPPEPRRAPEPPDEPGKRRPAPRGRRPQRRERKRRSRVLGWLAFAALLAGLVLAAPYALNLIAPDQTLNNISVRGTPIGGMSRAAVNRVLQQRYGQFARAPLTFQFEGQTWQPSAQEIGVDLDLDQDADALVAAGRSGTPLDRAQQLWRIWRGGLDLAPATSVNLNKLQLYLSTLAPKVEQPPRDTALNIADARVLSTPAVPGRQLLVDDTIADAVQALRTLEPVTITLRTRTLEPVLPDTSAAQAAADAQSFLQGPLTMRRGTQQIVWDQATIAELIKVEPVNGALRAQLDPSRLSRAVERLAQLVDSPSAEPRATFRGGVATITSPGQTGWRLRQADTIDVISRTLKLAQRQIQLPADELRPQVTSESIAGLGLKELVAEGRTSFAGSAPYRVTNIQAGARRIDGVMIAPGEEFSFNTQLGAVDESNGFVQGYAVIGDRTQLEWGGGVCQVSTTLFRSAFYAGLPITERHAHPFYISWYDAYAFPDQAGPGMDATIYTGVLDLKFVNDTGHWLLLQATADEDAQELAVRLYGTKPPRTVTVQGPEIGKVVPPPDAPVYLDDATVAAGTVKQTDTARKGMDITVYRIISEQGTQREPEAFFTRFKAWPNVFVRGTKP